MDPEIFYLKTKAKTMAQNGLEATLCMAHESLEIILNCIIVMYHSLKCRLFKRPLLGGGGGARRLNPAG